MNGIRSLNAGAYANLPQQDIRLSGDHRPTYTQRRRDQMAYGGIAGLDGRKRYGIGSWFQEKVKDPIKEKFVDPAIDFVTENPMLTAAGIGLGVNQFGIPGMDKAGQGWIQDLIGGGQDLISRGITGAKDFLTPGTFPDYSGVTGVYPPGMMGGTQMSDFPFLSETGFQLPSPNADKNIIQQFGGWVKDQATGSIRNVLTGQSGSQQTTGTGQDLNIAVPMGIGAAAGLYQKKYLEDQPPFPGDETGIKFQTAKQVMEDEGQRFKPLEKYVEPSALAAEGGRIGYATGGKYITKKPPRDMDMNWGDADTGVYTAKERFFEKNPLAAKKFMQLDAEHEQDVAEHEGAALFDKAAMMAEELDIDFMQALQMIREGREYSAPIGAAQGGRIGYRDGTSADWIQRNRLREIEQNLPLSRRAPITKSPHTSEEGIESILQRYAIAVQKLKDRYGSDWRAKREELSDEGINMADVLYGNEYAQGGRIGAQEGGLMNLGGMEKDYRQEGGFVPIGGQEKADDVPARLSKNEFVFTADAVRAAGGGDIDEGAKVMENLMENLEAGGQVSEESQGAQGMYNNMKQLETRVV